MYRNIMREIGAKKTSITKVAKELGMNRNTLAAKISGRRQFTLGEVQALSEMFNKSVEYLAESDRNATETKM